MSQTEATKSTNNAISRNVKQKVRKQIAQEGSANNAKRPRSDPKVRKQIAQVLPLEVPRIDNGSEFDQEGAATADRREQLINVDALLAYMRTLGDTQAAEKDKTKKLLHSCVIFPVYGDDGTSSLLGKTKVEFRHQRVVARVYTASKFWWADLFSQSGRAREAAASGIYVSLDFSNMFPALLEQLCHAHKIEAPALKLFNADREAYMKQAIEHYQPTQPSDQKHGSKWNERKAAKELFSAGYNGAGGGFVKRWRDKHSVNSNVADHSFVLEFFQQNSDVADKLIKEHYADVLKEVETEMTHKERPVQTALHCVLARMETKCRVTADTVAQKHELRVDSLQHDGVYARVDTPLDVCKWHTRHSTDMQKFDWPALCKKIEESVLAEHRYTVKITWEHVKADRGTIMDTRRCRHSDFVANLPMEHQMEWFNRHFVMLTNRSTDAVAKLTYDHSNRIEECVPQPVNSFKTTFAGLMVLVPDADGQAAAEQVAEEERAAAKRARTEETHDNCAFADYLETDEFLDKYMKRCPKRKPKAVHDIAERVRNETRSKITSRADFSKISGVDQVLIKLTTQHLQKKKSLYDAEVESARTSAAAEPEEPEVPESDETDGMRNEPSIMKEVDLAAYWCRSQSKRVAQDVTFEAHPVGSHTSQDPDLLNLFSGLPHDDSIALGSTLDSVNNTVLPLVEEIAISGPCGIKVPDAAFGVLKKPTAQFAHPMPEGVAVILSHIQCELCDDDPATAMYVIRYLAFGYKYRAKTGVMLVLLGEKGTGKSSIFSTSKDKVGLIPRLYGHGRNGHFKEVTSLAALTRQFADAQDRKSLFVTVEEAAKGTGAGPDTLVEIRTMLTSGYRSLESKYGQRDSAVKDCRNFAALINPDRREAFTIETGDRRFAIIEGRDRYSKRAVDEGRISVQDRAEYFTRLWGAIEDPATVEWLARYFTLDVDLESWQPDVDIPHTKVRAELQELNRCPVQQFLEVWQHQSPESGCELLYSKACARLSTTGAGIPPPIHSVETHILSLQACQGDNLDATRKCTAGQVFEAFKGWKEKNGIRGKGLKNLPAFAQTIGKYVYEDNGERTGKPGGMVCKQKTRTGVLYWIHASRDDAPN